MLVAWAGGIAGLAVAVDENCPFLGTDFLRHYYPTLSSLEPDRVWYYPPTIALLLTPFGWLPAGPANNAWMVLQLVLLAVWAIAPPFLVPGRRVWLHVGYTVVTVGSVPLLQNFAWGQVSTGLSVAGLAAFVLLARRPVASGVLLGIAGAAKVYPLVWLAWPAVRRSFRAAAAAAGTVVALAGLLPVLVLGASGTVEFYRTVAGHLTRSLNTWIPTNNGPQYLPAVVARLTDSPQSPLLVALGWIVFGALLALLFRVRSDASEVRALRAFAIVGGLFAFVVRTSWLHYFVHLPIAWLVLAHGLVRLRRIDRAVVGVLLAVSVLFSGLPWQLAVAAGFANRYAMMGWLAWANLAALTGIAWLVLRPKS